MDSKWEWNRVPAKRRLACENSQFSVFLDDLSVPGQCHVTDYLVVAPKQVARDLVTGVAILPVVDGKIGLLKVYRHAIRGDSWEIPRGFIEEGESDLTSALRELEEETGLSCDAGYMKSLGFVTPDAGILAARVHVYVALQFSRIRPYVPREFGHREFCHFSCDEIKNMLLHSEIQDPCTMIACYRIIPEVETLG
jgi:ADP-ribose pyrophosphatase